jgi:hypothetical protein
MSFASVYGAARRGDYSPGTRLVLACIASHANEAGIYATIDQEIADEMRLSIDTVSRGIVALVDGGDLEIVRHKRRKTTYRLPRYQGKAVPRPRHEPEVERRIPVELTPQIADSSPELTPQIADSFYPTVSNPTGKQESAACATLALEPILDVILAAGGLVVLPSDPGVVHQNVDALDPGVVHQDIHSAEAEPVSEPASQDPTSPAEDPPEAEPVPAAERVAFAAQATGEAGKARRSGRKTLVPADWQPSPEGRAFARQRGLDPDLMRDKFVSWHQREGVRREDHEAAFRCWCVDQVTRFAHKAGRAEREASFNQALGELAAELVADGFQGIPKGTPLPGWAA